MEGIAPTRKPLQKYLSGIEVDFAKFLDQSLPMETNNVEQVQITPLQFWER